MLTCYIRNKLKNARYKLLKDGSYFGEIPGANGVWASAADLETCRAQLQEVLEDWFLLKLRDREQIQGFRLRIDRRALVRS